MLKLVLENKDWIFSGIGVLIVSSLLKLFFNKKNINFIFGKIKILKKNTQNIDDTNILKFNYSKDSGLLIIGEEDFSFDTMWSKADDRSIYAFRDGRNIKEIGYNQNHYIFPSTKDFDQFEVGFREKCVHVGELILWRNRWDNYLVTRVLDIKDDTRGALEDNLTIEYKIYK
ncbi:hypothetical protein [Saccharibacillus endophyticus]|uniref:Uncharacterized protein n=1 Tax=Saccharibacillus endophyticus TaxID=2060666 RepID=A0ABQ2A157_9BACL|nr:hypothetical protein [Saccharibacillus endophyticus]GGH81820.1 hypothetical protein GCM10007362_32200 [Saccharibacillus endophyticus]